MLFRLTRAAFRLINKQLNKVGILISKPEVIHGSPAFSGATLWARRLNQTKYYFDLIRDVDGDIVESGVHWGYGVLIELSLSDTEKARKIFGFDSFSGHSTPHKNDYAGGGYKPLDNSFMVSENDVWKTLELGTGKSKTDIKQNVELIHGWIQETMPVFRERARSEKIQLALVHADCDIYEPFKATLENTWDALAENGVIILGRLNNPELQGKTIAFREFMDTIDRESAELCEVEILDNGFNPVKQSYLRKRNVARA